MFLWLHHFIKWKYSTCLVHHFFTPFFAQPGLFGIFWKFGIPTRIQSKALWVWAQLGYTAWACNGWPTGGLVQCILYVNGGRYFPAFLSERSWYHNSGYLLIVSTDPIPLFSFLPDLKSVDLVELIGKVRWGGGLLWLNVIMTLTPRKWCNLYQRWYWSSKSDRSVVIRRPDLRLSLEVLLVELTT